MSKCQAFYTGIKIISLYYIKVKRKKNGSFIFYIADQSKGIIKYGMEEFPENWVSTRSKGMDKGIIIILTKTPSFVVEKPLS